MDKYKTSQPCPNCGIGNLYISRRPLVSLINGNVISVPGAIYRTCDVCNFADSDSEAKKLLADMLETVTPKKPTEKTASSDDAPKQASA